jgi:hypothetical protein
MNRKDSGTIPLEVYHGVPNGWSKADMVGAHRNLNGSFCIDGEDATEPGAPAFLPDRYNWLQYRQTLYRVCEGVRENDEACTELAIRYIELNYMGSYSGFIREKLARALKSVFLAPAHAARLKKHFQWLIDHHECFEEFAEYKKLLNKIESNEKSN